MLPSLFLFWFGFCQRLALVAVPLALGAGLVGSHANTLKVKPLYAAVRIVTGNHLPKGDAVAHAVGRLAWVCQGLSHLPDCTKSAAVS